MLVTFQGQQVSLRIICPLEAYFIICHSREYISASWFPDLLLKHCLICPLKGFRIMGGMDTINDESQFLNVKLNLK